jgi:hypothetical protein
VREEQAFVSGFCKEAKKLWQALLHTYSTKQDKSSVDNSFIDKMDEPGDNSDVSSPLNSGKRQRESENEQSPESEKESSSSKRSKREEDVTVEEAAINNDDGLTAKAAEGEQVDASGTSAMDEECKANGSSVPGIADALSPVVTRSRSEKAEDNSTSSETSVNKPLSDDAPMTPVRIGVAIDSGTVRPEGRWRGENNYRKFNCGHSSYFAHALVHCRNNSAPNGRRLHGIGGQYDVSWDTIEAIWL